MADDQLESKYSFFKTLARQSLTSHQANEVEPQKYILHPDEGYSQVCNKHQN